MRLTLSWLAPMLVATASCLTAQQPAITPIALDAILLRANVWELDQQALDAELTALHFEWISAARDVARSSTPGLVFRHHSLNEAILAFRNGKLAEARLSYFNRGDSPALREDEFEALLAGITTDLSSATGVEPSERGRDPGSVVRAQGRFWDAGGTRYLLEWSATKASNARAIPFRAEFIRLTLRPLPSVRMPVGAVPVRTRDTVKAFVGRDHVERLPNGDAKLKDLPMVDQGQKGYCVVASVERIMRYYGAAVDQHELAQIANTDASLGTSTGAMLSSLRRLTGRLGITVRSLYQWDVRDFLKLVDDYNRATKRGKLAAELRLPYATDSDTFFAQVKPEIYKEARMKSAADFGRFQRDIRRNIDEGIPLLWSVHLGIIRESNSPQRTGGHMRIIVGYNQATSEILYSDSWGQGHEEKRMPMDDAWTITNGLSSLQPLS
jgi:Peptidase_C39 like family